MASTHRGWRRDIAGGELEIVYDGTVVANVTATKLAMVGELELAGILDVDSTSNFAGEAEFAANVHIQSTLEAGADGVGADGEQFTSGGAGQPCDWAAAASLRQFKNILGIREDAKDVLQKIVNTPVYDFTYRPKSDAKEGERIMNTGDTETVYTGIMADEAPELMHHHGRILNPINTTGYLMLAIKGLYEELTATRQELAAIKAQA